MARAVDGHDDDDELARVDDCAVPVGEREPAGEGGRGDCGAHARGRAQVYRLQRGAFTHAVAAAGLVWLRACVPARAELRRQEEPRTQEEADSKRQVPRTINMLNAFRAELPPSVASSLNTRPSRLPTQANVDSINARGQALWKSIYRPLAEKLENKLADAHPDLPVFIISSEYGALFTDPERSTGIHVGRVTTSLCAIACLRAQQGVGPQVLSHVFGLRKAWDDGTWKTEPQAGDEEAVKWLVSDEGCTWVLEKVDEVVEALGGAQGSTFAPVKAKL
ncbi:hypothetical protein GRF29_154g814862 [Pseudopithomyces chartarum]|uniref:Dol-P-Man:Man(5)GlcNAc(2)-PP-Dol alpha-1,3-mannosyltransferase n=1 Tax=Pseudopithomyces chartarum TaxID=1892770 RepID=A0AAN6LV89_9PLEO|nr:hypothetical protein GRF29_154g814862 [Pseudopithomyces chartarum]